ncbi:MAG: hypothetical protein QNK22_08160 [Xanthomonadales bacterium]|nr:hypothetical protein [Xanthomonadales bacterium]
MKKLIILPLLVLLTGCVSYYSPETALEDGVYFAEDDPAYVLNSSDYSGVVYYPWSSLDYFYLGYGRYHRYAFAYGYPYGWGYSPWGYPYGYHGYYSAWAGPYHHRYYRPGNRGNCPRHGGCRRDNDGDRDDVYDRIAREDHENRRRRDGPDDDNERSGPYSERKTAGNRQAPVRRYGSRLPAGRSGTQDKVIRNNDKTKSAKSRLEPVKSVPAKNVSVSPTPSGVTTHRSAPSSRGSSSSGSARPATVSSRSSHRSAGQARSSRRRDRD